MPLIKPQTGAEIDLATDLREMYALATRLRGVCQRITDRPPEVFTAVFQDGGNPSLGEDIRDDVTALKVACGQWLLYSSWPYADPPLK